MYIPSGSRDMMVGNVGVDGGGYLEVLGGNDDEGLETVSRMLEHY